MSETRCPTCRARVPVADGVDEVTCEHCLTRIPIELKMPAAEEVPAAAAEPVAASHEPVPAGTFPVTPFVAPTGGNPVMLLVPLIAAFFATIVITIACAILQGYFWLVIVFPLLHGAALGLAIGLAARLVRYRRKGSLAFVAVGSALLSVLGIHFLEYLAFLAAPGAPQITFWRYMDLQATAGVQLSKAGGGGGNGTNLGYTGSIIYWSVEALLTALGSVGVAAALVTAPFCEACNAWKRKRALGPYKVEPTAAVQAVANGVPAEIVAPSEGDRKSTLVIYACPHCGGDGPIDVQLQGSITEGKKTWSCQVFVSYPGEALAAFEAAVDECDRQGLKTK